MIPSHAPFSPEQAKSLSESHGGNVIQNLTPKKTALKRPVKLMEALACHLERREKEEEEAGFRARPGSPEFEVLQARSRFGGEDRINIPDR